ncbi:hypothetical protein OSB04_013606 [Centaurea solstitialis]|uniref:NAD-dependent epimerase/dehydratase domain-containing protein n=1 Tax=Centaurea solstitialis TaxID=347529 RepID=A0AA38WFN5_9ASTR|nr:hypothetical protein OSB04_013606 [Centaurea solstitialis]
MVLDDTRDGVPHATRRIGTTRVVQPEATMDGLINASPIASLLYLPPLPSNHPLKPPPFSRATIKSKYVKKRKIKTHSQRYQLGGIVGEGRSGRKHHKAVHDMHDRRRRIHRLAFVREIDVGDAAHGCWRWMFTMTRSNTSLNQTLFLGQVASSSTDLTLRTILASKVSSSAPICLISSFKSVKFDSAIHGESSCDLHAGGLQYRPLDTIYSNFIDALPVVKYCSENNKRLIHFSTCEVYGKTIGSYLPKDSPLRQDPAYYILKEDTSPCIFGSIEKQRWSYACAKQLIERLIYAEGAENGLEFTIVRPFNWIGPRMDFIPGIDGPSEGVPRVLACFSNNLLRREPLKLVDGGESQRTFVYIKDAIEAVLLMIENPARANGHIFNVGNPNNEVTVRQLAEMMTKVYSKVSGEDSIETPTIDVSSKEFYGEGYDDSDKRIPDMTIINKQLGWDPKTSLWDLLESTLTYQHRTYAEAVKQSIAKAVAN